MKKHINNRPICINYGCNMPCTYSSQQVKGRFRPHCSRCHKAGYGYIHKQRMANGIIKSYPPVELAEGVTPFKTGKCSNQNGHLGFPCPMDYIKAPWSIGRTELDHKDGNHTNNTVENIQELCPVCHIEKSKQCGDYRDQNNYKQYTDENGERREVKIEQESKANVLPI